MGRVLNILAVLVVAIIFDQRGSHETVAVGGIYGVDWVADFLPPHRFSLLRVVLDESRGDDHFFRLTALGMGRVCHRPDTIPAACLADGCQHGRN